MANASVFVLTASETGVPRHGQTDVTHRLHSQLDKQFILNVTSSLGQQCTHSHVTGLQPSFQGLQHHRSPCTPQLPLPVGSCQPLWLPTYQCAFLQHEPAAHLSLCQLQQPCYPAHPRLHCRLHP